VVRYATALIFISSLGPLHSQQRSAADAQIASNISATAQQFESHTRRFSAGWYQAGDLNSVLAGTRQQLLDDLPPDDAPLRAYVMQNFPAVITGIPPNKKINMTICGPYLSNANEVLNSLKAINAYRLDLIVDSDPPGALFELTPVAGDKLSRASRGILTNVWRGVYHYTVAKEGEKTITGTLNLVREKGNLLRCTFVHITNNGAALPCDFITSQ
jgi:hypothetical protein